jgi:predicted Zn-dependent protease
VRGFLKIALVLGAGAMTSAASTPQEDFTVPTWRGAYQPVGTDEQGLWMEADEDERTLRDSRLVIADQGLNTYLHGVLCRTVGDERCGAVRIYVVRVPFFNASMAPNGTMRIYSGLLLRVRNEAELASVLGHEFAHFELRHTLDGYKRARTGSDLVAWTAVLGALAARYGGGSTNTSNTRTSVLGTLAHFSRQDERAADVLGFAYMTKARYRSSAAADVWRGLMNEADSSATARGRRSARYDSVAFFASHPTDLERADTLSLLANRVPGGEYDGADALAKALAPWRLQFLEDQLMLGDFGGTDFLLERLAGDNWTAPLLFARGELYRARGNPRDLVASAGFYREALAKDPALADADRGLGLSLLRTGQTTEGKAALGRYLAAVPDASDAALLRSMVEE